MGSTIAYLAQGRLYLKTDDEAEREIESQFAERANERARRDLERHGWRAKQGDPSEMMSSSLLWRSQAKIAGGFKRIQISGVAPGAGSELLFVLNTESIGGIFAHDTRDGSERRLFHKNQFRAGHLAKHRTLDLVAISVTDESMSAHIGVTDTEGRKLRIVTEGDSLDESPSWVPGDKPRLVFQSAGVGRNAQGFPSTIGAFRIEQLDLESGEMATLVEDDKFDHLGPRVGSDGALYFIRRPWTPVSSPYTPLRLIKDVVLFPLRLLRALIYFCNFFSLTFSGKPLLTSGGPDTKPQDTTRMMLWGKMIDAETIMKNANDGDAPSLVPSNWHLVRRSTSGSEEILRRGVLSFDLASDGTLAFTNGSAIFKLGAGHSDEALATGKLIQHVHILHA